MDLFDLYTEHFTQRLTDRCPYINRGDILTSLHNNYLPCIIFTRILIYYILHPDVGCKHLHTLQGGHSISNHPPHPLQIGSYLVYGVIVAEKAEISSFCHIPWILPVRLIVLGLEAIILLHAFIYSPFY